ncbi:MAG: heme exporter protein CcmD [Parvularculaceae bacterium]
MGGHAAFIWPAYAVSAVAIAGLVAAARRRSRRARARLAELERDAAS